MVWIIKTVARWVGGDVAKATGIVGWVGFGLAVIGTGLIVHTFDTALHRAEVAEIQGQATEAHNQQLRRVVAAERDAAAALARSDDAYAELARTREEASAESADLSRRLDLALDRLRRLSAERGGTAGVSAPGPGVDGCADLRAALARALGAVDILKAAGDRAARDGQHAVDVAISAHQDALARDTPTPEGR